ncbi:MAG: trigger factor, partial [Oscillospiraceae bacterium]
MNLVSSNKTEKNTVELEIKVDGEEFANALTKACKNVSKKINVPGFRPGKAPKKTIEKLYGENVFVEEAIELSYQKAYSDAIDQAEIEPVDAGKIEMTEANKDGYTFKAIVTVKPEVEIKDYKGIKVEKEVKIVDDKTIDEEVNRMAERNARLVEVNDRAAVLGDTVIIDYSGAVDNVKFDGGTAQMQTLALGSGQFIPGFEEQVAGHNIGEEFDVTVTFPEQYQASELAGKEAVFTVKLHEIKGKELPVIDDEFAKDVSEFDTLETLKKDIAEKLQKQYDKAAENGVENQIFETISANLIAEIPQCMFDHSIDEQIKELEYRLQSQGMTLDLYMQYTGTTKEMLRETYKQAAEQRVKVRLALEKISEIEKIEASEEDIAKEIEKMAEQYKMKIEEVKAAVPAEDLKKDLAINRTIEFVKENSI